MSHPVWGPDSRPLPRQATDRHCQRCDVRWNSSAGDACWLCGRLEPETPRCVITGMSVAFPGTLDA